ncbi:TonB-dependent receptor [Aestuariibacter sp. A3R04]|uniref:TonB-dependent receptor n=1 Tax=Aestuariibacter sp. A3R04 TaxID=2841571 RepID=UPI001C09778F|nr:TonB-dependent receptor [Aestuariibacter sp. A3R04]MBU3021485.1 TonB-dependent receptor [Aestuariibacter sp. A3R04]
MKKDSTRKAGKLYGLPFKSGVSLAVAFALNPAFAQDVTQENESDTMEVIEIRGILASQAENLAIKRLSNSIVDAITSEDIGKFPDKNVADSLQRVPGVVITRDGGEGSAVSIRGLGAGLTLTQLNGNYIASTPGEPTRQFDFNLLPSTMIQRVEVVKSPEARYDEGGVGGTIRAFSRKPFDLDANTTMLSIEGTYADVTKGTDPHYSALYSWKDEDETYGFLVGYTYQKRQNRTLSGQTETWRWWRDNDENGNAPLPVDTNGNVVAQVADVPLFGGTSLADGTRYGQGFWGPQVVKGVVFDETRKREGVQATVQWRPTENLTVGANFFGFTLGLDSLTNSLEVPEWSLGFNNGRGMVEDVTFAGDASQPGAILTGVNVVEDAGGTIGNTIHPWLRANFNKEETTSDTFDIFADYEGDFYTLRFVGGRTKAKGGPEENFNLAYYGSNWPEQDPARVENASTFTTWQFTGESLAFNLDSDFHNNLANGVGGGIDPGSTNSSFVRSEQEETFLQLDADIDVDWGPFQMLRVGVKHRDAEVHRETGNTFYLVKGSDGSQLQQQSYVNNGGIPALADVLLDQPIDNITGGFSTNIFPAVDINKYRDYLNSNYEKYTRIEDDFVYDVGEKSLAYYVQGDFQYNDFRGNVGVRVVETEQSGQSTDTFLTRLDHTDDETGAYIENIEGVGYTQTLETVRQTKKTTDVLPSLNISWEPIQDIVFRGAVAKVISRPGYGQIGSMERLTLVTQEYYDDRKDFGAELGWSGSGGNKNLKPFEAWQYDAGVEWYYDEASVLGIFYFVKEVDNFIVNAVIPTTRNIDGEIVDVDPYSTVANGSEASVNGFEIFGNYNTDLGLGVVANLTLLDSEQTDVSLDGQTLGKSTLPGTADQSFNFSVFYEQDNYSVRASYNYTSEQVQGLNSGLTLYTDAYDQVDINASYSITENLSVNASVVNLTKSEQYAYLGEDTKDRFVSSVYSGRRFYMGMNLRF